MEIRDVQVVFVEGKTTVLVMENGCHIVVGDDTKIIATPLGNDGEVSLTLE